MAWCVGSIFPTPDLLTEPSFESPLLDALDPPQHLFDTGCSFRAESFPEAEPHQQVDDFLEKYKEAFFPNDLLCQHLQEDALLRLESSQNCFKVGNRLEGITNREGALQIFFPVGENSDQLGSCLLPFKSKSSRRICGDDGTDMLYSSSLPVRQPILQISANKIVSSWDSKLACVPLAVRTPYQVHWLTSQFQDNDISLTSGGVENFDYGTSHVVWNPHLSGEAAVILRNGVVNVFNLTSSKSDVTSFRFKMQDCRSIDDFSGLTSTVCNKRKRKRFVELKCKASTINLWSCEYTWHPRNLLVGGGTEIDLIDLRQKAGSKLFQSCLANAPSSTRLFSNCKGMTKVEHFTAIARGVHDDMFQFAAASTNHLTLFDIRQPKSPLLQWAHRMQPEPPGLLQMFSFKDTCSNLWNPHDKNVAGGRVILACAFRSGDIQAFPYGPQPKTYPPKARHMCDLGIAEKFFSWDFPVKLSTRKLECEKNLEHLFEAHGNNLRTLLPTDCGVERLAGLINCSLYSESSAFTLLQLTGSGSILSQSLHVMEEQGLSTSEQSLSSSKKWPFIRPSPGGRRGTKHYRMEYMPAFFTFLQDESAFLESKQKTYMTAAICNASSPSSIELTLNDTEKELQRPSKECVMPGPILEEFDNHNGETSNKEDLSTDEFFREVDSKMSPVNLSFKSEGATLQSGELDLLTGLRNLLEQWQQSFEPYATHCNLEAKKAATSL
ncbi:hypothetical protein GOP47_0010514 [Adiantum capillus-veneris]|uniref:Uncharacterized protein n=1 Tax=Adiantum capillus-veneris TaxID=13818 RepID=A0A9D4UW02_ADICA|nr:hypothetical protein GOP47_0010514 [Adiantum capillus-veneris]